MLTNTLYVDFGTRLGTKSMPEVTLGNTGGWDTFGYVPPNTQNVITKNWVYGPDFNFAGNPTITYTPLQDVFNTKDVPFQIGQQPVDDPFQFQSGSQAPLSQIDLLEGSILQMLRRMYAPFDIQVVEAQSTGMGGVGDATRPPTTPAAFMAQNNPLYDPNTYDPTATTPNVTTGPLFDPTQLNPGSGAPNKYQDAYILVGGWTLGNTQVGDSGQLGIFATGSYAEDADTFALSLNPANRFLDPTFTDTTDPSGNNLLRYSDGGGAVAADEIIDHAATGQVNMNVAMATSIADAAAKTWGLSATSDGVAKPWNSFFDTNIDLLSSSDVTRQGPYTGNEFPTSIDMPVFSNFSMMYGDLNQDTANVQNAYQQFINDPDIGPGFYSYITGTGAYDKITVTADPTTPGLIDVTVAPYVDNTFDDASFISSFAVDAAHPSGYMTSVADPYSYTIDPSTSLAGVLIELGRSDDIVQIDPAIQNVQFTVFGGQGVDNLTMTGDGSQDLTVVPQNTNPETFNFDKRYDTIIGVSTAGTLSQVVDALEFDDNSNIQLNEFNSMDYELPQFLPADFAVTTEDNGDMLIDGTAGPTTLSGLIGVANVRFTDITTVDLSDPVGATNETITVDTTDGGFANGLQNFEVDLGPGNDVFTINGPIAMPVPGGAITYDGGTGIDTVNVSLDTNWTLTSDSLTDTAGD
ncbi:MAG TPA: hypothetical protein VGI75_00090, partial [Pirellulales bacterium]